MGESIKISKPKRNHYFSCCRASSIRTILTVILPTSGQRPKRRPPHHRHRPLRNRPSKRLTRTPPLLPPLTHPLLTPSRPQTTRPNRALRRLLNTPLKHVRCRQRPTNHPFHRQHKHNRRCRHWRRSHARYDKTPNARSWTSRFQTCIRRASCLAVRRTTACGEGQVTGGVVGKRV